ncbi:MAG TPA: hypothetical protein VHC91_00525 [Trinickia sp.]|uniref:hypothetical protein n=1 Tax=Trinickia sp. TaxID=2571163 RepID=UPI002D0E0F63|nr:hypothetical protein [Trinickia sp.]HVW48879.1 hypothetical protein [Trinickia sp.]
MTISFIDPEALGTSLEDLELAQWMHAWYDRALNDGHIHPTYEPDSATIERLQAYYNVGLTPSECVGALFGKLH